MEKQKKNKQNNNNEIPQSMNPNELLFTEIL